MADQDGLVVNENQNQNQNPVQQNPQNDNQGQNPPPHNPFLHNVPLAPGAPQDHN